MPIEIQHGGQGGTAAGQILAQAGQAQANREQEAANLSAQLRARREEQSAQIDAQAKLQEAAADQAMARTALQHGLDKQLKEDEFNNELAKVKEAAKSKADQWEYQYTAKQRQDIARFNTARQSVNDSEQFTPEEKQIALRMIDQQQANIKPSMMPRDPSKPTYPDGQGVGQMWTEQNGTMVGRKPDGSLQLIQRWDQGPEGKQEESRIRLQEKLYELRYRAITEDMSITGANGKASHRQRTPEEVERLMQAVVGGGQADQSGQPAQQPQPATQQQPRQQQPAQRKSGPWWEQPASEDLDISDDDKRLPDQIGLAQAVIRTANAYGGLAGLPDEKRAAYMEAIKILRQYQQQSQQAQ